MTEPFSFVIAAVRRSHWIRSYALLSGGVKYRSKRSPRSELAPLPPWRFLPAATSTTFLAIWFWSASCQGLAAHGMPRAPAAREMEEAPEHARHDLPQGLDSTP